MEIGTCRVIRGRLEESPGKTTRRGRESWKSHDTVQNSLFEQAFRADSSMLSWKTVCVRARARE